MAFSTAFALCADPVGIEISPQVAAVVSLSHDRLLLGDTDGQLFQLRLNNGELERLPPPTGLPRNVDGAALCASTTDGSRIAVAGTEGITSVWNRHGDGYALRAKVAIGGQRPLGLVFSTSGDQLAIWTIESEEAYASGRDCCSLWCATLGKDPRAREVAKGLPLLTGVTFHGDDGAVLAAGTDGAVRAFSITEPDSNGSARALRTLSVDSDGYCVMAAAGRHELIVAAESEAGWMLRRLSAGTFETLAASPPAGGPVTCLSVLQTGDMVFAARGHELDVYAGDGLVPLGSVEAAPAGFTITRAIEMSGGRRLAVCSFREDRGHLRVVDVPEQ
ncbi:WD40 repeat domain-containing protein [Maioricimonas rarisocia]|uniref:hypothetical protein n=1 Tax=Maioricimonas rarisocia TaxID=2528026 RepID=UPI0018D20DB8|nr:hypothetical protein [Maioricimonas rarisocia]